MMWRLSRTTCGRWTPVQMRSCGRSSPPCSIFWLVLINPAAAGGGAVVGQGGGGLCHWRRMSDGRHGPAPCPTVSLPSVHIHQSSSSAPKRRGRSLWHRPLRNNICQGPARGGPEVIQPAAPSSKDPRQPPHAVTSRVVALMSVSVCHACQACGGDTRR